MGKLRPKDGDVVLHCGHLGHADRWHWFGFTEPIQFTRPDGTSGAAQWQIACERCFLTAEGNVEAMPVQGDSTWLGDEPIEVLPKN